jgi:hypothetical protein
VVGQGHFADQSGSYPAHGDRGQFNLFDQEDLYNANVNLSMTTHNIFQRGFETSAITYDSGFVVEETDEGFEDFVPRDPIIDDFQLFPSSAVGNAVSNAKFGENTSNVDYRGVTAQGGVTDQELRTAAAATGNTDGGMDWSTDEFPNYKNH